ncbi:hypothetical protein [Caenimonas soli]|uniref:hypothetical protein n=1 Tax=Caenimonas soli TaxID=2735555 RepID=UPI00155464C9|nr:hypothetical protein [Caenimonas soli]NPC59343.1 hypothetical protein [Caenimonas soli]
MVKLLALSDLHLEFVTFKPDGEVAAAAAAAAAADVVAEAVDVGRVRFRGCSVRTDF